jgi:uncharacterized protein
MTVFYRLVVITLCMCCFIANSECDLYAKIHQSPNAKIHDIGINDVSWTSGFWYDKFELCHRVMVPHLWEMFSDPSLNHVFTNFKIAAGIEEGESHGPPFNDGDFYKWLEAAAFTYSITKDDTIDRLMDRVIEVIAKAQRADGYIHTPVIIGQKNNPNYSNELQNQLHFETYNMGHLMTTACVHYRATGKTTLLDVAVKVIDYLIHVSENSPVELARVTICPSHYMGVIDMYRITGNIKYLQLAKKLIDIRSLTKKGTDHNQDRIPFREQTSAVGHAVRGNYLYQLPLILVQEPRFTC